MILGIWILDRQYSWCTQGNSDRMKALLVFVCIVCTTKSLDNGLGRTPQMGWNSWTHFRCSINAQLVMDTAGAMVCVFCSICVYWPIRVWDCHAKSGPPLFSSARSYLEIFVPPDNLFQICWNIWTLLKYFIPPLIFNVQRGITYFTWNIQSPNNFWCTHAWIWQLEILYRDYTEFRHSDVSYLGKDWTKKEVRRLKAWFC